MKHQRGIVWVPILIMVGVVFVTGIATYLLIQASAGNKAENKNTNVADVNNTNGNINSAINTNQTTNNNASINTNTAANTNTVSNTNAATGPTAGWKTYTNTSYGYSIRYPKDYSISEALAPGTIQIVPPDEGQKYGPELGPTIFILHNRPLQESESGDVVTDRKKIVINSISATQQTESGLASMTATYFPYQSAYIKIQWPDKAALRNLDFETYNQILSTFQFTD
jgi:cytoskeletal protein RodZ